MAYVKIAARLRVYIIHFPVYSAGVINNLPRCEGISLIRNTTDLLIYYSAVVDFHFTY